MIFGLGAAAHRDQPGERLHKGFVVLHLGGHSGVDQGGRDGVDANAVLAAVASQGAGQVGHGALGDVVAQHLAVAAQARDRGGVDDAAPALLQMGIGGAASVQHAVDVDGHDLAIVVQGHGLNRAIASDAGVVVDDIQGAEAVDGGLDHALDLVLARDIDNPGDHARRVQAGQGLGQAVFALVGGQDVGALAGEAADGGLADAGSAAGDDHGLS
nr:hypothetical protein [Brevundimonas sp.]